MDDDAELVAILRAARTVAVLGAKPGRGEPAYYVPAYLAARGYRILPVNPVHVLDLALVLPGMMATSVMLSRRRPAGYLFTVPLLVFSAVMGVAIEAMAAMMALRDIAVPPPMIVVVAGVTLGSLALVVLFLRRVGDGA